MSERVDTTKMASFCPLKENENKKMTEKRFEVIDTWDTENNQIKGIRDNQTTEIYSMDNELEANSVCIKFNELADKNEELKEHQRTLEAKIVRLKDRVKTFEKHYSLKDIERYKKMDNCNCITSERLE